MSSGDDNEKLFMVIQDHFLARFNAAIASLTGDPTDEFFMTPMKALGLLREWINKEMQNEDLLRNLLAATSDERLQELRDQHKRSLRAVMEEIESRHG